MKKLIKEILQQTPFGEVLTVNGWIRSVRNSKAFLFVVLTDGSTQEDLQLVVDQSVDGFEAVSKLRTGAAIRATGEVVRSEGKQTLEIQVKSLKVYSNVDEDYPLQKKGTSLEFLREIAHLRPRTNTFGAVFRIRHTLAQATHEFFSLQNCLYVHTPIITAMDAEGAGELFRVSTLDPQKLPMTKEGKVDWSRDYFAKEAYLCVTGQLEGEAFAQALGRIYTFGPTFRSENSNTARHLSEFWMIEPEIAFAELDDIAKLAEDYIKFMIKSVMEKCPKELEFLNSFIDKDLLNRLNSVVGSVFTRITYTKAVEILQEAIENKMVTFDYRPEWGNDLQTEHERYLTDKHFKAPVIVTNYPQKIKAFYMKLDEGCAPGKETVQGMDVLVPGVGEIIGGSVREENFDLLVKRMDELKMEKSLYSWYLDLRRFGSVPHGGFGLGFERAVMYLTGMSNIRDVIPFYRTPKHLEY